MQTRGTNEANRNPLAMGDRRFRTGAFLGHDGEGNRQLVFAAGVSARPSSLNARCETCGIRLEYIPGTVIRSERSCSTPTGHHLKPRLTGSSVYAKLQSSERVAPTD